MNHLFRKTQREVGLYHSPILSIPIIGNLLYNAQYIFFILKLIDRIYISNKENAYRAILLKRVRKDTKYILCRSGRFGRVLQEVTDHNTYIIFDTKVNLAKLSVQKSYVLMWTLMYCKAVSRKAKRSLDHFLPNDFPVSETVFLPYHEDLNIVCDYVLQTARSLVKKGHIVYLIPVLKPLWILRYFMGIIKAEEKRDLLNISKDINILRPLRLIPAIFNLSYIQYLNQKFAHWSVVSSLNRFDYPIIWCFDHKDLELVQCLKNRAYTIYDCVDYWSSRIPQQDKIIREEERQLIENVNLCVVNSTILKKLKEKIRKDIYLVPLGFDYENFVSTLDSNKKDQEADKLLRLLDSMKKPKIGFVGTLSFRIDFALLKRVITSMPSVNFIFTEAPKVTDDDYYLIQRKINELRKLNNVFFIPMIKSRIHIKFLLENLDICMIPYDSSFALNRFCFPMKLMEYFYTGKPVISTPIEELYRYPELVRIGKNTLEWKQYILELLSSPWPNKHKLVQKKIAENNSWDKKVETVLDYLNKEITT